MTCTSLHYRVRGLFPCGIIFLVRRDSIGCYTWAILCNLGRKEILQCHENRVKWNLKPSDLSVVSASVIASILQPTGCRHFFLKHENNKQGTQRCSWLRLRTSKWLAKSSIHARIVVVWLCLPLLCFHSSGFVKVSSAYVYTKTIPVAMFTVISDEV